MGEAKRRKLAGTVNRECPCCNCRKVMLHVLEHEAALNENTGGPVLYHPEDFIDRAVVDFGILQLVSFADGSVHVLSYGEEVFRMWPDSERGEGDFDIVRPGRWIGTLASIQADLAERFGPVSLGDGRRLH
jgi:hypothetical protein